MSPRFRASWLRWLATLAVATGVMAADATSETSPAIPQVPPLDAAALAAAVVDPFPTPAALQDGTAFWKRVWSEWSVSQVILHDDVHPQIVYEVFDLPGPAGEVYTETQRDFVKARREGLQARLQLLAAKLVVAEPLDDGEKELALVIATGAGAEAIEGAHERVRSQRGLRERFLRGVELSGRYLSQFKAIFREAGLPEDLAYLPHVESSFQQNARSKAGAVGMWQFTRSTARLFMTMTSGVDERLDPVAAARGAARYMKRAFDELGSWPLAVTSYNHGLAGMRRAKALFGNDFDAIVASFDGKAFGFASRNFYMSFVAARELAKVYETSPPEAFAPEPPLDLDHVVLEAPSSAKALAHSYHVSIKELTALNRAWTHNAVSGRVRIPAGVTVWLPAGTLARVASGVTAESVPEQPVAGPAARVHTVARGDSLSAIAQQYGVPLTELLSHNGLRRNSVVRPGQRIRIPAAN